MIPARSVPEPIRLHPGDVFGHVPRDAGRLPPSPGLYTVVLQPMGT